MFTDKELEFLKFYRKFEAEKEKNETYVINLCIVFNSKPVNNIGHYCVNFFTTNAKKRAKVLLFFKFLINF